ncbi:MAG: hypothetical protein CM1200mP28_10870 [Deltaproteobacteria bacterium]|nr:MAG: hypothetical protein CM1200mP28_10870 [Deltaproteobacteria bacterium]
MEDLLEDNEIEEDTIHAAIKKGVQSLELCPVYMGSAFKNKGVQLLRDALPDISFSFGISFNKSKRKQN